MIRKNTYFKSKRIHSSEMKHNLNSSKDWTDDFSLEFGNSICTCCICHEHFLGFKHRVICKECGKKLSENTL